jgi:hypothetical protein
MSDEKAISHLWELLQHRGRWYIDFSAPDNVEIQDIALKAKQNADIALSNISRSALIRRYNAWERELPPCFILKGDKEEKYFDNFLSDVAFDLAEKSLKGNERKIFQESINLFIRFL